jgi:hypothetical protein
MESVNNGRAIIEENLDALTIKIPSKKLWYIWFILPFWLGFMLFWEGTALYMFFHALLQGSPASIFMLLFIGVGGLGVFYGTQTAVWLIKGHEILTFRSNELQINRVPTIFSAKTYEIAPMKNIRLDYAEPSLFSNNRRMEMPFRANQGITFDYGMKTIRFGAEIDEAEARHLLELLVQKGYFKDEQLSKNKNQK